MTSLAMGLSKSRSTRWKDRLKPYIWDKPTIASTPRHAWNSGDKLSTLRTFAAVFWVWASRREEKLWREAEMPCTFPWNVAIHAARYSRCSSFKRGAKSLHAPSWNHGTSRSAWAGISLNGQNRISGWTTARGTESLHMTEICPL